MGSFRISKISFLLSDTQLSVYYYFYERSKGILLARSGGGKAISTAQSIMAGLIAGVFR